MGINELKRQLEELGYTVKDITSGVVSFIFIVPLGRFKGQELEIALQAAQFPNVPPPGILLNKNLLPNQAGGVHPTGGIHIRSIAGRSWQYWSRPFNDWATTDRTAKTYLAFIRTLFDFI